MMDPSSTRATTRDSRGPSRRLIGAKIGGFYLVMAGINIGLTVGDVDKYRHFADGGLFPFVRTGWVEIVMAHPEWWIGLLAAGEIAIGLAFFGRKGWLRAAYAAAICFHFALMLFGWGVWLWAVPALVLLVMGRRHDLAGVPGQVGASLWSAGPTP